MPSFPPRANRHFKDYPQEAKRSWAQVSFPLHCVACERLRTTFLQPLLQLSATRLFAVLKVWLGSFLGELVLFRPVLAQQSRPGGWKSYLLCAMAISSAGVRSFGMGNRDASFGFGEDMKSATCERKMRLKFEAKDNSLHRGNFHCSRLPLDLRFHLFFFFFFLVEPGLSVPLSLPWHTTTANSQSR